MTTLHVVGIVIATIVVGAIALCVIGKVLMDIVSDMYSY